MPTIPQTQTVLQSYFQTGDVPTQNQFLEFIGTMFYLYNATLSAANAAAADAATVSEALPLAAVTATYPDNGNSTSFATIIGNPVNVSAVTYQSTSGFTPNFIYQYSIHFTVPISYKSTQVRIGGTGVNIISESSSNIVVQVSEGGGSLSLWIFPI